jgi:hypothetical protein
LDIYILLRQKENEKQIRQLRLDHSEQIIFIQSRRIDWMIDGLVLNANFSNTVFQLYRGVQFSRSFRGSIEFGSYYL